ncbi:MAG: hypothetical protein K2Q18_09625, partial [Bdellovibrionales bacterium]|nr:hypothetical protein [Bdellovibrionales bacterium]
MVRKFLLFLFIILFSFSSIAAETKYVSSLEEFYMHMKNHVDNVGVMADRLFLEIKRDPKKWKDALGIPQSVVIDEKLKLQIKEFISLHDASKLNTSKEFLAKIKRETGLINDLYTVYGKPFKDMTEQEKRIVDALNVVDKAERDTFIKKLNLPDWGVKLIDEVEKISDGVERGMNPVTSEEMAKVVWKESEAAQNKLNAAVKTGQSAEEIKRLKGRLELILKMEEEYKVHATKFTDYKNVMGQIQKKLRESGIITEYLDEFASYRLIDDYQKFTGKKINPNDPNLIKNLKSYFFQNKNGVAIVSSSFNKATKNQAQIMLEL